MFCDLTGMTAIVTGGAQGIGRGIALVLAEQGANVVIADVADGPAAQTAREIEGMGRKATTFHLDVTDTAAVTECVTNTIDRFGHLSILVNNAGVGTNSEKRGNEDSGEDWDLLLSVNLMGVVNSCNAALRHMKERRTGKIVNIASMSGHAGRKMSGAYATSKAAVLRYTKGLAYQLAPLGINVNAVCPGAVWTGLQERNVERRIEEDPSLAGLQPREAYLRTYEPLIPMGRDQTPEDIGKAVAFLASKDARNITGECLHVDGGAVLRD